MASKKNDKKTKEEIQHLIEDSYMIGFGIGACSLLALIALFQRLILKIPKVGTVTVILYFIPCIIMGVIVAIKFGRKTKRKYKEQMKSNDEESTAVPKAIPKSKLKVEKNDYSKCLVCHTELNLQRQKLGGIMSGNSLFNAFDAMDRSPYKCRKCGAPICKSCASTSQCPKCGGNVFDLDSARIH